MMTESKGGQEEKRGRDQRGRNGGGTAKRQAMVVDSVVDELGREGDRGGGREKYGCAEGKRNE